MNLTWIESFPVPERERAYLFFVEMEGHQDDPVFAGHGAAAAEGTAAGNPGLLPGNHRE